MPEFNIKEESEFIQVSAAGDVDRLSILYESDPSLVNKPASNGYYPLMFAAYGGHLASVEWLIKKENINIDEVAECGEMAGGTALWIATALQKWDVVQALLKAGAKNVDATPENGPNKRKTVLLLAASFLQWDIVPMLLERKPKNLDATFQDGPPQGKSTLWFAVACQQWSIAQALLDAGLKNVDAAAEDEGSPDKGITALCLAAFHGKWDMVRSLLQAGAKNVDATPIHGENQGKTTLSYAAAKGEYKIIQNLLALGASIDIKQPALLVVGVPPINIRGSALETLKNEIFVAHFDSLDNYLKSIKIIKAAEDLFKHAQNKTGTLEELNKILKILGPALNACKDKKTALQMAIESKHTVLIKLLLSKGANRLNSEDHLLHEDGNINLAIDEEIAEAINPTLLVCAKLAYIKSLFERILTAEVSLSKLKAKKANEGERTEEVEMKAEAEASHAASIPLLLRKIRKIEAESSELIKNALLLDEPFKSQVFLSLSLLLCQGLHLTKTSLQLIKNSIENVHPLSGENYKQACALYVQLSLGEPGFDALNHGCEDSEGLDAELSSAQLKNERIRRALVAQDALEPGLVSMLTLGYILGPERCVNSTTSVPEGTPETTRFAKALEVIREEVIKLKDNHTLPHRLTQLQVSDLRSVEPQVLPVMSSSYNALSSSCSSALYFMHPSAAASHSASSVMSSSAVQDALVSEQSHTSAQPDRALKGKRSRSVSRDLSWGEEAIDV